MSGYTGTDGSPPEVNRYQGAAVDMDKEVAAVSVPHSRSIAACRGCRQRTSEVVAHCQERLCAARHLQECLPARTHPSRQHVTLGQGKNRAYPCSHPTMSSHPRYQAVMHLPVLKQACRCVVPQTNSLCSKLHRLTACHIRGCMQSADNCQAVTHKTACNQRANARSTTSSCRAK